MIASFDGNEKPLAGLVECSIQDVQLSDNLRK
jgi:hypothetical protein